MLSEPFSNMRLANRVACRGRISRRSSRRSSNTIERPITKNFVQKDLRRCEFQIFVFFETCIVESGYSIAESQHSHGECFLYTPSVRKVMQSEAGEDLKLPPLHEALELLYKLVKPMHRSFKPTSLQEMIEHRAVPKDYKGFANIDESTAKAIWSEIVLKYPMAKILEVVPLDAVKVAKFSWHDKLLANML